MLTVHKKEQSGPQTLERSGVQTRKEPRYKAKIAIYNSLSGLLHICALKDKKQFDGSLLS